MHPNALLKLRQKARLILQIYLKKFSVDSYLLWLNNLHNQYSQNLVAQNKHFLSFVILQIRNKMFHMHLLGWLGLEDPLPRWCPPSCVGSCGPVCPLHGLPLTMVSSPPSPSSSDLGFSKHPCPRVAERLTGQLRAPRTRVLRDQGPCGRLLITQQQKSATFFSSRVTVEGKFHSASQWE